MLRDNCFHVSSAFGNCGNIFFVTRVCIPGPSLSAREVRHFVQFDDVEVFNGND